MLKQEFSVQNQILHGRVNTFKLAANTWEHSFLEGCQLNNWRSFELDESHSKKVYLADSAEAPSWGIGWNQKV